MSADPRAATPEIPEPPWWTSSHQRGRRTALSREAIVDAALRVLDRDGLEGLSMRRVADELDAGAASLYWHVASKDVLLTMVIDRVTGEIELPEPDPEHWEQQLRALAHEARAVFRRHPGIAQASMGRVPLGPNILRMIEWQLELFLAIGMPPAPAAWFGDLFALYLGAHGVEDAMGDDGATEEMMAATQAYFAELPEAAFPRLTAMSAELMAGDADARFDFGLDVILRGVATFVQR